MCDSRDYWGATLRFHIGEKLGMKSLSGDPSLYIEEHHRRTIGLLGSYVDDYLPAGDYLFIQCIKKTLDEFESKPMKWDDIKFLGVRIRQKRIKIQIQSSKLVNMTM